MSLAWTLLEDPARVAETACDRILSAAEEAIRARGRFTLVLAGGSTPEKCYHLLASREVRWDRWEIFFGDERCLAPDHPERNSRIAAEALTDHIPLPQAHLHPIPAELGPEAGAAAYSRLLQGEGAFDLVLLGIGEDGHTASLFPGHEHPPDLPVVAVTDAPKPPPERVSLGVRRLENCRNLLILVTGQGKQEAVSRWRQGARLPVSQITPVGKGEVLIDRAAWGNTG